MSDPSSPKVAQPTERMTAEPHRYWKQRTAVAEASLAASATEVEKFKDLLECERSKVGVGVKAIQDALEQRDWLTEGRGSYEWDDDRWHSEFAAAGKEILQALEPLVKISGDLSNCPTDWDRIVALRTDSAALVRELAKMLRALNASLDEVRPDPKGSKEKLAALVNASIEADALLSREDVKKVLEEK